MSHYGDCSCVVYREQARESDLIHVAGSTRLSNSGARGQQTRLEDARASPDGCPSGLSHDPTDYMIRPANTAPCGEFTLTFTIFFPVLVDIYSESLAFSV